MSEVTGVVEKIASKEVKTRFGAKPTYSVMIGGQWYKCGFNKPRFNEGDSVTFLATEGTYGMEFDAKSVTVAASSAKPAASKPAPYSGGKGVFPIPPLDGQRAIVRQNALTNAREVIVASWGGADFTVNDDLANDIIALARKFESYACGDLDVARAQELKAAKAEVKTNPFEEGDA